MAEYQCQLDSEALIHAFQYRVTVGACGTGAVIGTDIPPLVGDRGPGILVDEIFRLFYVLL